MKPDEKKLCDYNCNCSKYPLGDFIDCIYPDQHIKIYLNGIEIYSGTYIEFNDLFVDLPFPMNEILNCNIISITYYWCGERYCCIQICDKLNVNH